MPNKRPGKEMHIDWIDVEWKRKDVAGFGHKETYCTFQMGRQSATETTQKKKWATASGSGFEKKKKTEDHVTEKEQYRTSLHWGKRLERKKPLGMTSKMGIQMRCRTQYPGEHYRGRNEDINCGGFGGFNRTPQNFRPPSLSREFKQSR